MERLRRAVASGAWEEAEALARRWCGARPRTAEAWWWRGRVAMQRGEPGQAERALREAVRLQRDHAGAWHMLGAAYGMMDRPD
ncbi:MAG: tetratricopeptide repeat protein, partial [Gammaproteobacteria bacterium]|nr:tetratricopeptide repeat protein [Gammaproteobacteria bacterium]NIR82509.1 tetratricopeptide repeat protein [Gammaproteobacteria bacterium]NIU03640.1 tetratricopeptide repeat protein [Gammaproteobacteria bacterium]NIX84914.1 tetratricopeptide repeat protein [Gammaproteobacteria bacterium]